jgi:hypothetical protein
MKSTVRILLVAGFGLASGLTHADVGYVSDGSESITRTGFGECVHTERWSEEVAVIECEPAVVAAREAAKLAAVEVNSNRSSWKPMPCLGSIVRS